MDYLDPQGYGRSPGQGTIWHGSMYAILALFSGAIVTTAVHWGSNATRSVGLTVAIIVRLAGILPQLCLVACIRDLADLADRWRWELLETGLSFFIFASPDSGFASLQSFRSGYRNHPS